MEARLRKFSGALSEEDAQDGLAGRLVQREAPPTPVAPTTLVASLDAFSTRSALGAKINADRFVSPDAPVAQVDRAAVS